ncbi:MAG: ABC transporter substrate-binding protein [Gammaproteobacteria bacterium]|nr:ABC transporter substrate-binding protein [Gammaproteobacteria bacterium]MCP4980798.1 ABC transporter substrate-binding protein [Gammaproteobacteria bacterium]
MKLFLVIFSVVLMAWVSLASAQKPQRIVSIGLCTDQLLLMLAEREQIASLSLWAVDRNMSYLIDAVGNLPLNDSSVEDVIRYQPDLVVASQFAAWDTARFLRQLGYQVKQIPPAKSIADIYGMLRQFGEWTGNPQRAEDVIEQMQRELAEIRQRYIERKQKTVIVYSPNGFTIGANTLENDMFVHAGYRNLAAEMGIDGFMPIALESLVAADPDVLQIDRSLSRPESLATAYVGHPVLDKLLKRREFLDIPTRLRICAGPMIVEAIDNMAQRR